MKPTDEQQRVITTKHPRCQVLACPGSGKTWTLFSRYAYLREEQGLRSDQILVLSHSNAAVDTLRKRLPPDAQVMTIHSFGNRLIQHGERSFTLLNDSSRIVLLKRAVKEVKGALSAFREQQIDLNKIAEIKRLAEFVVTFQAGAAKQIGSSRRHLADYSELLTVIDEVCKQYQVIKERMKKLDYVDMIKKAHNWIGRDGTNKLPYEHLLVDEYQDLSTAQAALLKKLAANIPNIIVFADSNQSIYGFAGQRFRDLSDMLPNARNFKLTESFRLTQESADFAVALLNGANDSKGPINALECRRSGLPPEYARFECQYEQEAFVVGHIEALLSQGIQPHEIAVLGRTRAVIRDIEQALRARGIEARSVNEEYSPEHMERVIAVLKLMERYISRGYQSTHAAKAKLAERLCKMLGKKPSKEVIDTARRKFEDVLKTPGSFTGHYVAVCRIYLAWLRAQTQDQQLLKRAQIELSRYEPLCYDIETADALSAHLARMRDNGEIATSTIHAAKGREWKYVYVVNVVDGCIPFHTSTSRTALDEERRLLYVAVTRASEQTVITMSPYENHTVRKRFIGRSQFLPSTMLKQYATKC